MPLVSIQEGGIVMKWFAIMDGDMFLQDVVPNKNYIRTGRAIQTNLHSYNEFSPVFSREEKWFDSATISGMIPLLIDFERWDEGRYKACALICKRK